MFVNENEDFVLGDDECYILDGKSLREKLLDVVEQQEESIKKIMQCLFVPNHSSDRDQRSKEFTENVDLFIGSIKRLEFGLAFVRPHTEREDHVRKLQDQVDERDAVICKLAREMKAIETALVEATFQAEKKLEVFQQAQENKVNSEEVIRFAHMISRNYSVAAPFTWTQGDPSRPFPTEADFAVSNLMNYRNFPGQNGPTAFVDDSWRYSDG
ncbi:Mediator of RNA polymerase II transcription subunit 4 [Aphelenchoides bicaudatus]|nr:Mediator of RNA polymerase II transcription subunit 4 [Aphelenchoides bicaudatus]